MESLPAAILILVGISGIASKIGVKSHRLKVKGQKSNVESRESEIKTHNSELRTPNWELSSLFDPDFLFRFRAHCLDLGRQGIGDLVKRLAVRRRAVKRHRPAFVARGADIRVERDLAEKRQAHFFRGLARAAVAENLFSMPALRAEVIAHILDNAKYGDVEFAKHRDGLGGHCQRQVLWRRDNHRAGQRNG